MFDTLEFAAMPTGNDLFYDTMPARSSSLGALLTSAALFQAVPDDWHVVITDIRGSTKAVREGRHEQVNLIATGSIVVVLNIAFHLHVTVPFFFGGDGATFIVPPMMIDQVMHGLEQYKANTQVNFDLDLRAGTVPVAAIYAEGHHLQLAKFSSSPSFVIPILTGNGLNYAEKLIKGSDALMSVPTASTDELDMSGMQCRWDRIAPPVNHEEVVTLLVIALDQVNQTPALSKVINALDRIYGTPEKRQPISVPKLKLKTTFNRLGSEMRATLGKIKPWQLFKTWLLMLYGYIYFRTDTGKKYLNSLVEMSDTLVVDGKINTVISGNQQQRKQLQKVLDQLEQSGEILYGLHTSSASIMSCYVRDHDDMHVHFVDGSEGGYTQAATMLKAKL